MREVGVASLKMARYLEVSRGNHPDILEKGQRATSFHNFMIELSNGGMAVDHIRLLDLNSPMGEIERVGMDGKCYIIFDQFLGAMHHALVRAFFEYSSPTFLHIPGDPIPAWANALFAARYLSRGLRKPAAYHAIVGKNKVTGQVAPRPVGLV
jgi:hypothetical protein